MDPLKGHGGDYFPPEIFLRSVAILLHSLAMILCSLAKANKKINEKYSCKQRCGFLQRLRNQGKMYILHNFGKKSKRRKEEWKKERIEERRVKKGKKKRKKCLAKGRFDRELNFQPSEY